MKIMIFIHVHVYVYMELSDYIQNILIVVSGLVSDLSDRQHRTKGV